MSILIYINGRNCKSIDINKISILIYISGININKTINHESNKLQ